MAGRPGSVHVGKYDVDVRDKPNDNGRNNLQLQTDDTFIEQHTLYDPSQFARDMGTTMGGAPQRGYEPDPRIYAAECNHDAFQGGDAHLLNLDEGKVICDTVFAVPVVYAGDQQKIFNSDERTA